MSAMRMTSKTPLRDLLIYMADDAIGERLPDLASHCRDCRAAVEGRCPECAGDEALADEYDVLADAIRDAETDSEAIVLPERHAALLAAETGMEAA